MAGGVAMPSLAVVRRFLLHFPPSGLDAIFDHPFFDAALRFFITDVEAHNDLARTIWFGLWHRRITKAIALMAKQVADRRFIAACCLRGYLFADDLHAGDTAAASIDPQN